MLHIRTIFKKQIPIKPINLPTVKTKKTIFNGFRTKQLKQLVI